jgi:acyl carrier protein
MHKSIEEIISGVLKLSIKEITNDVLMKDTDAWDSLSHMSLILALEEEYVIEFSMDEIVSMVSVLSIREIVKNKLDSNGYKK